MSPAQSFGERWWDQNTTAVVTGANKGIGKEIARLLAENGVNVILTSREKKSGDDAASELKKTAAEGVKVYSAQLDITKEDQVHAFARLVAETTGPTGGLDILINNAGLAFKGDTFGASEAQQTFSVNYEGTKRMCQAITPLMRKGSKTSKSRVVNVCSMAGKLRIVGNGQLRTKFESAQAVAEIDALVKVNIS
jgi:carbonyl reductase 1